MKSAPVDVRYFRSLQFLWVALALALFALPALAQSTTSSSMIVQPINDAVRTTLKGSVPKAIQSAHDLGAMDSAQTLHNMVLMLKPSAQQQVALKSLLSNLYDKHSADYHKWLTPAQFGTEFGPSPGDISKVEGWLRSQGLTPTAVANGGQWIEFSGSVQNVNTAFATSMHKFAVNGQTHYANVADISIPQAITPVVAGVLSLNNFVAQPEHTAPITVKRNVSGKLAPVNPNFTTTDGNGNYYYFVTPADFQTIYDETPLLKNNVNGSGISIAIPGRSNIALTDIDAFQQAFGLPKNDPNIIVNGVDPGQMWDRDQQESTLDVEWAGAAAPGATINFVVSSNTDTTDGIALSSAYIVDNRISPIMSVSYGLSEALLGPSGNQFFDELWQQAAAEGITVFVSTGDGGAAQLDADLQNNNLEPNGPAQYGPSISGMSSTPYDVAVGGTEFDEGGSYTSYWSPNNTDQLESALGYIPEAAWNESCDPTLPQSSTNCAYGETYYVLEGGGGGPSNCSRASIDSQGNETCLGGYAKPSWQTGAGVPNDGVRDTPDLSLNASPDDDGYLFCFFGNCQIGTLNGHPVLEQASIIGGTSASAPTMAGIMALVEQKNGAYQGQADYEFYQLEAQDTAASCDSSTMTEPTLATTCNFHDVTLGNNSDPGMTGYNTSSAEWTAGAGYDMATGLGTADAANLVANWGSVTATTASTTTLTVGAGTVAHGQPLTVTIHVAAANGGSSTPTGEVALETDKYGFIGDVTLDASGNYSGPVSNLPGGTYNLTAHYNGDSTFTSSDSSPVSLTVSPEDSNVSVNMDVQDFNTGQLVPYTGTLEWGFPLDITVTVAGKSGQGNATGTVNLLDNGNVVLSGPLTSSGTVSFVTGGGTGYTFPNGTSTLTVQYLGDSSFNASTSAPLPVTQQKAQEPTYVGISWWQVPAGQPVFFTATVPPSYNGDGPPTGTIQFYDNGQPIGSAIPIVNSGGNTYAQVKYEAKLTTVGTHSITAGYSGDANFAAVSGTDPSMAYASQFQVVPATGAATTTTIVQNPTSVSYGQSFTYTVKVAPVKAGGPMPTGQVTISSDGIIGAGPITLVNGQGSAILNPGAGTSHVYAQYGGDSNYAPSTSSVITTTVSRITTPAILTSAAPYVLPGLQTSLSATVTGYNFGQFGYYRPQGTVQFFTSVNGGTAKAISAPMPLITGSVQNPMNAVVTIPATLPTGTNVVSAVYSGDQNFNSEPMAPVTVVVTPPDFTLNSGSSSMTVSAGASATEALSLSSILGFNGTIALSCGSGLPAGAACSFSPSSVVGGGQSNLTVAFQGPFPQTQAKNNSSKSSGWASGVEVCGLFGLFFAGFSKRRRKMMSMMMVLVLAFGVLSGCGSDSGPSSTLVVVGSTQSKVASGTAVTFTAQVSNGDSTPNGTITFYDGATALGSPVKVSSGSATLSVQSLAVGVHQITAKYSGDSNHSASVSQPYYEAVTGTTTLQVLASSGSTSHSLNVKLTVQ